MALVFSGIASVPVGRWLDQHGPRLLMTIGSSAAAALILAWSSVRDVATFYLLWILIGICMATVLYGPAFATVTVWFRRRRAEALTAITLMAGLASTIFIPLTAWLVSFQGWRSALVTLAALLATLTIAPHALLLRRSPADLGLQPDGERAEALKAAAPPPHEPSISLGEALRHPTFPWLLVAFCFFSLNVGVPVHLVPYLSEQGYPPAFAAGAAGLIGAMQLVGRFPFAPLERRLTPGVLSIAVFALQPLALLALLLVRSAPGVLLFVALFGASRGAETLMRSTVVARLYGPKQFASISGVISAFITIAQAAAPVSLGLAYDTFGRYEPALWSLVLVSSIAAGAIYFVHHRSAVPSGLSAPAS